MIECYDNLSRLQFSSEMFTMYLRRSGSAVVESSSLINAVRIPGSETYPNALIALAGGGGYIFAPAFSARSSGQRLFDTSAPVGTTVEYFLYEPSSALPPSPYGLECLNAAGQITFSAFHRPLLVTDRLSAIYGGGATISRPGRKLAFCSLAFAGFNSYYDEVEETPGQWYANHDLFLYGAFSSDGGSRISTANLILQTGYVGPFPGGIPDTAFDVSSTIFVMDVTHVPIGQTFF